MPRVHLGNIYMCPECTWETFIYTICGKVHSMNLILSSLAAHRWEDQGSGSRFVFTRCMISLDAFCQVKAAYLSSTAYELVTKELLRQLTPHKKGVSSSCSTHVLLYPFNRYICISISYITANQSWSFLEQDPLPPSSVNPTNKEIQALVQGHETLFLKWP